MSTKARVIAFYLPQFHPIPENDKFWGKGFTEWTNVGKAKPLFKGHYQPRVPADLGYYDLRMPEAREAQAEMAKEAGVEGFMYWHYWFGNGKRLLEKPFNEVLASGKPDFPFCLGWANHSWSTHSWNSETQWQKDQNIVEQLYPGKEDYINHFNTVLPAFKDKRYITVDDKPLFLIYAAKDIPDPKEFIDLWRELALKNGLKGIHFVAMHGGWMNDIQEYYDWGFDAVNSRALWHAEAKAKGKYQKLVEHKLRKKFGGVTLDKYDYEKVMKHYFTEFDKKDNVYPTVIPQWDRSARSGRRAVIYHGSTPELFKKHLEEGLEIIKDKPEENKILFLKSWNEWAEGNYMEPDLKFGHGYLDALKSCVK
ncbi:glycosyl transferase [Neptunitalea chrysea]|uniref:Glycosyl transferase n=1 Tax=Neptunitalea chrysea TaxID=1647581 RepID=A0A9W6B5A3_9FLAO|nr:glycoside hydrolase family 99-like domain-containing protein [Neptunitalea chrysea]GLB51554.1 glycosyl transferase [Neptunitalea chrysea]